MGHRKAKALRKAMREVGPWPEREYHLVSNAKKRQIELKPGFRMLYQKLKRWPADKTKLALERLAEMRQAKA